MILTTIVVSNQVLYYYVVSYIALEYIDYWTRLNIDVNSLQAANNGENINKLAIHV